MKFVKLKGVLLFVPFCSHYVWFEISLLLHLIYFLSAELSLLTAEYLSLSINFEKNFDTQSYLVVLNKILIGQLDGPIRDPLWYHWHFLKLVRCLHINIHKEDCNLNVFGVKSSGSSKLPGSLWCLNYHILTKFISPVLKNHWHRFLFDLEKSLWDEAYAINLAPKSKKKTTFTFWQN